MASHREYFLLRKKPLSISAIQDWRVEIVGSVHRCTIYDYTTDIRREKAVTLNENAERNVKTSYTYIQSVPF